MKTFKLSIFHICIIVVLAGSGCKKLIEIPENSPSNITTEQVFADSLSAINGVSGLYVNNFSGIGTLSGNVTIYPALSADELISDNEPDASFYNNALIADDASNPGGSASDIWNGSYNARLIYHTNAAIEGITASKGLSSRLKDQLIGECKVIRDLTYFNLVNLFGDVPLAITATYSDNNKIVRSSQDSIYSFLIHDLTDASNRLPATYPSAGRARPNKYTALALLSKVQLYRKQWIAAESSATGIINSGVYTLENDLNNVFLKGSNEAIWQISGVGFYPYVTPEGDILQPYASDIIPSYYLNSFLLNAFETGDARKTQWLNSNSVDGTTYYYPYKYKNTSSLQNGATVEDYMIFRLAEQYLIRAEARVEQGNLSAGAADLNIVRKRAGLDNTTAVSKDDLIKAIMHERQTELFCEWGNRWFDLKRTGTINVVLGAEKPGIWPSDGHAALYPIPGDQIKLDPALTQNPGY